VLLFSSTVVDSTIYINIFSRLNLCLACAVYNTTEFQTQMNYICFVLQHGLMMTIFGSYFCNVTTLMLHLCACFFTFHCCSR